LLTANRDGIRQYELSNKLDQFANKVAADTKSALKRKRNLVHEVYVGEKFEAKAQRVQASILNALGDVEPTRRGKTQVISDDRAEQVLEILLALGASGDGDERDADAPVQLRPPPEAALAMMDIPIVGPRQVELIAQHFAWTPSFMVHNEDEEFHVSTKFRPEKMAPGLRKLARMWAELCRFVLIQLSSSARYGVGWIFDSDVGAQYRAEEDGHWLLLNPFVEGRLPRGDAPLGKGAELLNVSNPEHVNWLYAAAVHECTHLADGITLHNEVFASALTRNVARTANRGKQIEKIRKSIVARAPSKVPGAPPAAVPEDLHVWLTAFDDETVRSWAKTLKGGLMNYAQETAAGGEATALRDLRRLMRELADTHDLARRDQGLRGRDFIGIAEAHDARSGRLVAYWVVQHEGERLSTLIWEREHNAFRIGVPPKDWWDQWFGGETRTW
jgi:hypothetical protein